MHSARVYTSILAASLLLFISGCALLPELTKQQPADWAHTVAQRQAIDAWKISARLGVRSQQQNGSLDLFWTQQQQDYTIRLLAPLGQGTILIRGNAEGVTLRTKEGVAFNHDADAMLAEQLGVSLPVQGLRAWLRGVPLADAPAAELRWSPQGHLIKMQQLGWDIEMSDYRQVAQHSLPHAFYLQRADQPELGIKLIIHHWQLEPA